MTKPQVVIWGASSQARVVAEIVELEDRFRIAGFLDDIDLDRSGEKFSGYRILGGQEQLPELLSQGIEHILFGFGNNRARLMLGDLVEERGFKLASAIHPKAVISPSAELGPGLVIKAGAIIDPTVVIGRNVAIGSSVTIAHGCRIEDGARLSAGANVAGNCVIGKLGWIGVGATVSDCISIGAGSLLGAGSVAVSDIPAGVVAYGVPARTVRAINERDF